MAKSRALVVFIFFLTSLTLLFGQEKTITLSGKILDKDSKEPLIYASIGINGKYISTISNLEGDFELHLPEEFSHDTLFVSMLGYKSFSAIVFLDIGLCVCGVLN